jgi:replicative DNA helicase
MAKSQNNDLSEYVFGKVPPQALDLERAVLGALMIDREAPALVSDLLSPESFYLESHQCIYRAIIHLFTSSRPVDMLTVVEHLKKTGEIERTEGAAYVVQLCTVVASSANLEYHARIVQQKAISRQIIDASMAAIRDAYEDTEDTFEMLDKVQGKFFGITAVKTENQVVSLREATMKALKEIEATEKTGIKTGLRATDKAFNGFMPGELVVIAARPGMGKTEYALQIALENAVDGEKIWFVSLEMTASQLAKRVLSKKSGIGTGSLRSGKLSDMDFALLQNAANDVMDLPINFAGFRTPNSLWSAVRRAKAKGQIGALIVDYLQLIEGDGKPGNREREVADISRTLKKISTELDLPVIALSQLSRALESRANKMPNLADLRESGAIEQDADIVLFIFRPEAYDIEQLNISEDGHQKMVDATDGALIYSGKFRHDNHRSAWVRFKDGHFSDWPLSESSKYFPNEAKKQNDEDLPF